MKEFNPGLSLKIPAEEGIEFHPMETGTTFCENAILKAGELKKLLKRKDDIIIADDSGLCVDALDSRPGVNSAYYGEENGKKLSSREKNSLLLEELGIHPLRTAHFVCNMILLLDYNRYFIVQETLDGEIIRNTEPARGENGFGYDPIFLLPHLGRTLAELSDEEKNLISHRGKAGKQIAGILARL